MAGFERLLPGEQLQKIMAAHAPLVRRPPQVTGAELLVGLVYHVSQGRGSLGGHLEDLTGRSISDSAVSQRRLAMPWALFEAVLEGLLTPLADPVLHQAPSTRACAWWAWMARSSRSPTPRASSGR